MSYASQQLALSPAVYLRLGEAPGAGTAVDETSNHIDGSPTSVTFGATSLLATDTGNTAASFDGAASRIYLGNPAALQITANLTLNCWYKPTAFPSGGAIHTLLGKGYDGTNEGYYLRLIDESGTVKLQAGCYTASQTFEASWNVSGWSAGTAAMVTGVYDVSATRWRVYFNGTEVGTSASSAAAPASTGADVYVGAELVSGSMARFANGVIDEPSISASRVADVDLAALYAAGNAPDTTAPTISSATISALGVLTINFSEAVTGFDIANYSLTVGGVSLTLASASGSGSTRTVSADRVIPSGTALLGYTAGTTQDVSGNALVTVSGISVTNSSTTSNAQSIYIARKFGLFLVYGMSTAQNFSGGAGDEYGDGTAPASTFNAIAGDADIDQWLDAAKAGNAKYIVFSSVHVSGFCLWNTATTAYKSTRDFLAELGPKCAARGLAFGVYWIPWQEHQKSILGAYSSAGWIAFWEAQLTEIAAYSPDILWVDGYGYAPPNSALGVNMTDFPYATFSAHVASVMPNAAVLVNTHELNTTHSLVVVRETAVDGGTPSDNTTPAEEAETIRSDGKWFWGTQSYTPKSAATIAAETALINSRWATYLLNVPPNISGVIPSTEETILRTLGGDTTAPATPAGLAATAGNTTANVHWTANGEDDISHYLIYQSTDNSSFSLVGGNRYFYDNPQSGSVITGLTNGMAYYFKIRAVDFSGNQSAQTASVSVTPDVAIAAPGLFFALS